MKSLFEIDMYAKNFEFNINKESYKTLTGVIATFIFSITFILISLIGGKDLFYMSDPTYVVTNLYYDDYQEITSNSTSNITVALSIFSSDMQIYNSPEYFEIGFYQVDFSQNTTNFSINISKSYSMNSCSKLDYLKGKMSEFTYNLSLCTGNDFDVYGASSLTNHSSIPFIKIKKCSAKTEERHKIRCKDINPNTTYYLILYYQINYVSKEKHSQPVSTSFDFAYLPFKIEEHVLKPYAIDLFFTTSYIYDYDNFFTEDSSVRGFLSFDHLERGERYREGSLLYAESNALQNPRPEDYEDYFFSVSLYSTRAYTLYERHYIKFLNLMGDVGGVFSIMTFFFEVVVIRLSDIEYQSYLVHKLFNIEIDLSDLSENISQVKFQSLKKEKDTLQLEEVKSDNQTVVIKHNFTLKNDEKDCNLEEPKPQNVSDKKLDIVYYNSDYNSNYSSQVVKESSPLNKKQDGLVFSNTCTRDSKLLTSVNKLKKQRNKITISKPDWLIYACSCYKCCLSSLLGQNFSDPEIYRNFLEKINDEFDKKCDILHLFSMVNHLELMKVMMFTENQKHNLNSLKKQMIFLKAKNQQFEPDEENSSNEEELQTESDKILDHLIKLLQEKEQNNENKNLP